MYEFVAQYTPEITQVVAILAVVAPFLRKRIVSDHNLVLWFNDMKEMAKKVNFKEFDINTSINRINAQVDLLQGDILRNQEAIEQTIMEFTNSELIEQLQVGFSNLQALHDMIVQKDDIIENLKKEIKSINKSLSSLHKQAKG